MVSIPYDYKKPLTWEEVGEQMAPFFEFGKEEIEGDTEEGKTLEKEHTQDAIDAIKSGALYPHYAGMSPDVVKSIHKAILKGIKDNKSSKEMIKVLSKWLDGERAEMVWRTERHAVRMKAREIGWLKLEKESGEEFMFDVIITNQPGRTSDISKEVKLRVEQMKAKLKKRGLTLKQIKEIYKDVSTREDTMGVDWTGWQGYVGHPNERDRIVRVV